MKSKFVGVFMMMCVLFFEGHSQIESGSSLINSDAQFVIGKWVRIGPGGPLALTLKEDGTVGVDFGNDGSVDVSSKYQLSGDEITFIDEQGAMCDETGQYHILWNDHYIAFDLEQDECGEGSNLPWDTGQNRSLRSLSVSLMPKYLLSLKLNGY
jgi:hypothetical protein